MNMALIECSSPNTIEFSYQLYQNHPALEFAKKNLFFSGVFLKTVGKDNSTPYYYLKIEDDFIHALFPLLKDNTLLKPDYFSTEKSVGAHISVIYPEEIVANISTSISSSSSDSLSISKALPISELNQTFNFDLSGLIDIQVFGKRIVALVVSSPELEKLRIQYGFPKKLNYHNLLVPFHITLARGISEA